MVMELFYILYIIFRTFSIQHNVDQHRYTKLLKKKLLKTTENHSASADNTRSWMFKQEFVRPNLLFYDIELVGSDDGTF